LLDITSRAYELFQSSKVDQKRRLISFLLSNLELESGKLVYKLKEPFDAILQANESKEWLPLVDRFRTTFYGHILSFTGKFANLLEGDDFKLLVA